MTRTHRGAAQFGTALLALAWRVRRTRAGRGERRSRQVGRNQKKQAELVQMEAIGQRNDIDPPLK